MSNKKGFTMVELLVVLVIIGILAAVSTPLFIQNTRRAKASEAVATMGLLRQAMRDYQINTTDFFNIDVNTTDGYIQNPPPNDVNATSFDPTPNTAGLDVDVEVTQYFSNQAFSIDAGSSSTPPTSARFTGPAAVDFIIIADGGDSVECRAESSPGAGDDVSANCAIKGDEVADYQLEMDNSGRIFVCYNDCGTATNWRAY